MKITCKTCGKEFTPESLSVGDDADRLEGGVDTELTVECPTKGCDGRFYTFADLSWEQSER